MYFSHYFDYLGMVKGLKVRFLKLICHIFIFFKSVRNTAMLAILEGKDDDDEPIDCLYDSEEDIEDLDIDEDFVPDALENDCSSDYGIDDGNDENNVEDLHINMASCNHSTFVSKDRTVTWKTVMPNIYGRSRAENIIPERVGITRFAMLRIRYIKDAFELCFTKVMRKMIVDNTNLEGSRIFGDSWSNIDDVTIQAYIGILILAGVYRSHGESIDNLWHDKIGRPIFRATMSKNNFKIITRVLRFDNKVTRQERRATDKLAPIRDLWEKWIINLNVIYSPGENVTIDEQLVSFRGKCPFRQYMPSKPAKYGIKIWALCDSKTNYAYNLQIYTGKQTGEASEKNQGQRVVLDLVKDLKGRNITCDNFFTNYNLAMELLKKKNTIVGTVRANKTFLPQFTKQEIRQRPVLSSHFYYSDQVTLVQYVPKKYRLVNVLSTFHHHDTICPDAKKLPEIISFYNKTKAGVDTLDQLVGTYTVKRKSNRWPFALFCNIIDISGVNAFVLWLETHPDWNKNKSFNRRLFLEELGSQLVNEEILRRPNLPRGAASLSLVHESRASTSTLISDEFLNNKKKRKLSSGARCQFCVNKDRKAYSACQKCNKPLCGEHKTAIYLCNSCK